MKIYVVVNYDGYVFRCFYSLKDALSYKNNLESNGEESVIVPSMVELQDKVES